MARPAPAAPIIGPAPPLARVGPAPPAGFVRAAKCPALDRDRVDVQVDAVALADENALGALLQRATRTVGLLLWATVSEADNVAQGPFRLPVLRFEEVRTGRTVALVVRGSGELPTRKDALRYAAAAAATAPEVDELLAAHAVLMQQKDLLIAESKDRVNEEIDFITGWLSTTSDKPDGWDGDEMVQKFQAYRARKAAKAAKRKREQAAE